VGDVDRKSSSPARPCPRVRHPLLCLRRSRDLVVTTGGPHPDRMRHLASVRQYLFPLPPIPTRIRLRKRTTICVRQPRSPSVAVKPSARSGCTRRKTKIRQRIRTPTRNGQRAITRNRATRGRPTRQSMTVNHLLRLIRAISLELVTRLCRSG
jgi:hypothetical protein